MAGIRVSILVPAWREETVLGETLKALSRLDYPKGEFEVIVVAGGGETIRTASDFASDSSLNVAVIPQREESGKNQAILDGLAASRGGVIVLLDADSVVEPGWLGELVRPVAEGRLDVVNGKYLPLEETWVSRYYVAEEAALQAGRERSLNGAGSIAFGKTAVEGGEACFFDPGVRAGVDYFFALRAFEKGLRVGFTEKAVVRTRTPSTLLDFIKVESRWAGSLPAIREQDRRLFSLRLWPSLAVALSLVLAVILPGAWRIPPTLVTLAFAAKTTLRYLKAMKHDPAWVRPTHLPHYMILSAIFQFIMAYTLIRNTLGLSENAEHFKGPRPA